MRILFGIIMIILLSFNASAPAAEKIAIGTRQIHLDFHTSEAIPDIGSNFSKTQFQEALKIAHVNSINIFAKGHHSWSYYPTKVGRMHPNLTFDLLGAQIEACHEIGVLCPIYFTVGWSANDAIDHPEWCARNRDGSFIVSNGAMQYGAKEDQPKPYFQWINMCVNTPYHQHILAQVEEICKNYDVDGLWFDIYQVDRMCYCEDCMRDMKSLGIDPDDYDAAMKFHVSMIKEHQKDLVDVVHHYHPNATVFFNGTTAIQSFNNFHYKMFEYNSMQDLEDLPTVWGGYDKLPLQSKYFLKMGYPITAMSGKFHTSWGEFGGFKHPNALKYEAASMIAWGANCNFGDQLHPAGEMDLSTYRNIGVAYEYVEKIEDYGIGGVPVARVAVWRSFDQAHDEGLAKMLLEGHVNFDVANDVSDLSQYDVLLIPGIACLDEQEARRMNDYVRNGGGLIVFGYGALDKAHQKILLDIGAEYVGKARYDIDYLVVGDELNKGLVTSPFLNYTPAIRVKPDGSARVLADIREPYFSRTYRHYSSHQNTPFRLQNADFPGVLQKGRVIFFAHELDKMYLEHGARLHRDLFLNALKRLNRRPMVQTELPSAGRVSLLHQPDKNRYVAHLLYGPPIQRGECEVIEDLPPLYEVPVSVDLPQQIKRVRLMPDNLELAMKQEGGRISVTVPKFQCHCAIVFDY